jgi:hypothetical protein
VILERDEVEPDPLREPRELDDGLGALVSRRDEGAELERMAVVHAARP